MVVFADSLSLAQKLGLTWWLVWDSICKSGNLEIRSFAALRFCVQKWQSAD